MGQEGVSVWPGRFRNSCRIGSESGEVSQKKREVERVGGGLRVLLVSTWPEFGSRNVGDWLITESTKQAILREAPESSVSSIWREAPRADLERELRDCDIVFFSYLAIRRNLEKVYPHIDLILASGLPIAAVGAGASVHPLARGPLRNLLSNRTIDLLFELSERATVFTTRGRLTQLLVDDIGLTGVSYTGDIAFNQPLVRREFRVTRDIQTIGISSPHRFSEYESSLAALQSGLRQIFPASKIHFLVHGKDSALSFSQFLPGTEVFDLTQSTGEPFSAYDRLDLHVGFRVHGHVSALVRGKPSLLLEQDGRGADYGSSFSLAMSRPAYLVSPTPREALGKKMVNLLLPDKKTIDFPVDGVHQALSLVRMYAGRNFEQFGSLAKEIDAVELATQQAVKDALRIL